MKRRSQSMPKSFLVATFSDPDTLLHAVHAVVPENFTLAFVPICFELPVLLSALATVAALFLRAQLFPGKKELLFAEGVTDDMFALVLRRREAPFDTNRAWKVLEESGADRIRER